MEKLNLLDLIANGTMDAEIAALLSAVGNEQRSLLVVALPRAAGKSTIVEATIDCRSLGVKRHDLSGEMLQMDQLMEVKEGGYVVVAEFAPHDRGSYIWDNRARKALECSTAGYSLAASIHATSMEEAIALVCKEIAAGDHLTAVFQYVVYIERFGEGDPDGPNTFYRRIKSIHEIEDVVDGNPKSKTLFWWNQNEDNFNKMNSPMLLNITTEDLHERAQKFQSLVNNAEHSSKELLAILPNTK